MKVECYGPSNVPFRCFMWVLNYGLLGKATHGDTHLVFWLGWSSTSHSQYQMKRFSVLYAIRAQCAPVFQLTSLVRVPLIVWRYPRFVVNQEHENIDGAISEAKSNGDYSSHQSLDAHVALPNVVNTKVWKLLRDHRGPSSGTCGMISNCIPRTWSLPVTCASTE